MGKSSKKKSGAGAADAPRKLGRRKQLHFLQENARRAEEAVAAYKEIRGITDDMDLFAPLPPNKDCPICLVSVPAKAAKEEETTYMPCCGKMICRACILGYEHAIGQGNAARKLKGQPPLPNTCAFCRKRRPQSRDEIIDRLMNRAEQNDADAVSNLASHYRDFDDDPNCLVPQDMPKPYDLLLRAVKLGDSKALNDLAIFFYGTDSEDIKVVQKDRAKYRAYLEASAGGGHFMAHFNLGNDELNNGHPELALKHLHLPTTVGYKPALEVIQEMCQRREVTDVEFLKSHKAYKDALEDQQTEERDKWKAKINPSARS